MTAAKKPTNRRSRKKDETFPEAGQTTQKVVNQVNEDKEAAAAADTLPPTSEDQLGLDADPTEPIETTTTGPDLPPADPPAYPPVEAVQTDDVEAIGAEASEDASGEGLGLDDQSPDTSGDPPADDSTVITGDESQNPTAEGETSEAKKKTKKSQSKADGPKANQAKAKKKKSPSPAARKTVPNCPGCDNRQPITEVKHYKDIDPKTGKLTTMQEQLTECSECGSRQWVRKPVAV